MIARVFSLRVTGNPETGAQFSAGSVRGRLMGFWIDAAARVAAGRARSRRGGHAMKMQGSIVLALALGWVGLVDVGAETTEKTPAGVVSDSEFLRRASAGGMAEVKLSQVAYLQAVDAQVRGIADLMVKDHIAGNDQLLALAKGINVDLPTAMEAPYQIKLDELKARKGAEFDKGYLEALRSDHEAMISLFETASRTASDPNVRKYANDWLPVLRAHLEHTVQLQQR
jgi:putative membrane protein